MSNHNTRLIMCGRSDPAYKRIRDRHYVPNNGCIGQQLHYLIEDEGEVVGIISGCSSTWGVKPRDEFFGLTAENKSVALPSIINNCVYRLEKHTMNLATRVLAMWRKQIAHDWSARYSVIVHGFETFVVPSEIRTGALYRADNWTYLGETQGSAKTHNGIENKSERKKTETKLIFAIKVPNTRLSTDYHATWRKVDNPNQMELFGEGGGQ